MVVRALPLLVLLGCSTWASTGSVYRGPCNHVGLRPATDLSGVAATVQVTSTWPAPCVEPRERGDAG
jgi:hypothetical protein